MVKHIFPNFLRDEDQYHASEGYWCNMWEKIDADIRSRFEWRRPWFEPLPPSLSEGNPIFSAVSPVLRRGIRIIQDEPREAGLEIVAYPDTFGGTIFDPSSIKELVISCALSDVAAREALSLMRPWVSGMSVPFYLLGGGPEASSTHPTTGGLSVGDYMNPAA